MTNHQAGPGQSCLSTPSVDDAVATWFTDGSRCVASEQGGKPRFVLVTGTPASGKTRLRHEKYGHGYVTVDAGDVFHLIPNSEELDFPGEHKLFVNAVGERVARRAIQERRDIVTEVFGVDQQQTIELIESMKAQGYQTELVGVHADLERSMQWNASRGSSNVSSYYTDEFNVRWLTEAARTSALEEQP